MADEKTYAVWAAHRLGIATAKTSCITDSFSSAEELYNADEKRLSECGLSARDIKALSEKSLDYAESVIVSCIEKEISITTFWDADYPKRLKAIPQRPLVLYYKGKLPDDSRLAIASVGTRDHTPYGAKVAYKICRLLAESGCTVVSGLAKGNDGYGLAGALDGGSHPVAVLGCGVDLIYPLENKDLYCRIVENGCVMSEYPPSTPAFPYNFPQRNRIIAGLSNGVMITEAPKKSGALITARYALEYGKDLFAVPGSLFSRSSDGCNELIAEGKAKAVRNHLDVLDEYTGLYNIVPAPPVDNAVPKRDKIKSTAKRDEKKAVLPQKAEEEKTDFGEADTGDELNNSIVNLLTERPRHPSEISDTLGVSASEIASALTMLELDGYIETAPGGYCKRVK